MVTILRSEYLTVHLTELHTTYNQSRNDLTSALYYGVLSRIHIEASHSAKFLKLLHSHKAFDTKRTKGTIMTSGRYYNRCVDGVRVHARLVIMMHRNKGPIGN